jgi:membrane fusion protein, multidrug efflux system
MENMKRELVLGAGAVLAVAAASLGCHGKSAPPPPPPPPPAVVVTTVVQQDVPVIREWIGTTEGNVNAEIRPKVDGYLLRRVYAEGGLVRQGDLLFTIDPRQTQTQVEQVQADLAQAQAQLAKAQQDVNRFRPLAAEKAVSQQELDNALSAERAAKAAVDARQAAVHQARLSLGWARVSSPISGIAGAAQAQVGDLVSPSTVLTTVSQCDPIRVVYQLSEQEYLGYQRRIQQQPAAAREDNLELILADGSVFPHKGRVLFEGRQVDVKTGTIASVGLFPNPGNLLRPGQYAKIRAVTEVKKGALLVPQRAVNDLQGGAQVAVVGSDSKAEIRTVQTGERVGTLWVIDKGLQPGERVVVEGFTKVKSGVAVVPKEAPPEAPKEAPAGAPAAAGGK